MTCLVRQLAINDRDGGGKAQGRGSPSDDPGGCSPRVAEVCYGAASLPGGLLFLPNANLMLTAVNVKASNIKIQ